MEHVISLLIPAACGCEVFVDDRNVHHPVDGVVFHLDIHTRRLHLKVLPQIPIPTSAKKLRLLIVSHDPTIKVEFSFSMEAQSTFGAQAMLPCEMELVDPNQKNTLLEYLQGLLSRLGPSVPEK